MIQLMSYQHESLIAIFEERYILEFNQPVRNVVLVNEETCEQHEGNNQDWSQSDSELFIREGD